MKIEINTSVDDLRSSFQCGIKNYSIRDFQNAIHEELNGQKRISVLMLLNSALKRKKKSQGNKAGNEK